MTEHDSEPPRPVRGGQALLVGVAALGAFLAYAVASALVWMTLGPTDEHSRRLAVALAAFGVIGPSVAFTSGIHALDHGTGWIRPAGAAMAMFSFLCIVVTLAVGAMAFVPR